MFPKSRLNTVSFCSVAQDFPGGSLNLLPSNSGEGRRSLQQGCRFDSGSHTQTRRGLPCPYVLVSAVGGGGQGTP
jgi:hypothetical protein